MRSFLGVRAERRQAVRSFAGGSVPMSAQMTRPHVTCPDCKQQTMVSGVRATIEKLSSTRALERRPADRRKRPNRNGDLWNLRGYLSFEY
jgi:hypothetical protein